MNFLPAVVVISVVLLQTADALDRLCINGDNQIKKLFIDGKPYFEALKSPRDYTKCDCIKIPINSALIAVEAQMSKPPGRIQACNTAQPALYKDWVCQRIREPRKWKLKYKNWEKSGYDYKKWNWKPAKKTNCTEHCNNQYFKLPCNMKNSPCFWTQDAAANTIRCRLQLCADTCTDCSKAGPGKCNDGACKYGSGKNELTNTMLCQRRCRLEMKAYNTTSRTKDGYIRVVDLTTWDTDTFVADKPGDYYATVDMTNCSITNRHYYTWEDAGIGVQETYNTWNNIGSGFLKVIGVELGVGPDNSNGGYSYAPWIFANSLGQNIAIPAAWFPNNKYSSYKADLQGVQYGDVKVTNDVTTPP